MTNIARIFRKDLRRLWPQIALLWISAAVSTPLRAGSRSLNETVLSILPVVACWLLIVSSIHQEPLTGDRQYWLTRPFSWRDLLGAKVLFLAAFINLPLFALQARALSVHGFSPLANSPLLLWNQLFFAVFMVLPAASLAAVTRNLGQALLGVVLMIAAPIVCLTVFGWINFSPTPSYTPIVNGLGWVDLTATAVLFLLAAGVILYLQYSGRRVTLARWVLAVTPLLAFVLLSQISTQTAFAIQSLLLPPSAEAAGVRISLDARARVRPASNEEEAVEPGFTRLELPIRFERLPPSVQPLLDMLQTRIESRAGSWRPEAMRGQLHDLSDDSGWLTMYVDQTYYDRVKDLPVDLSAYLYLTLFRTVKTVKLQDRKPVQISPDLVCSFDRFPDWSTCLTPFVRLAVTAVPEGKPVESGVPVLPRSQAYAPYRVWPGFSALEEINRGGVVLVPGTTCLVVERPIAYLRRELTVPAIHLAGYAQN